MARPRKNNADYFSHDKDMRNDPKIKAIRNRFGLDGYAVWCMLLEVLTDADNFKIGFSELDAELLAGDFGVDPEKFTEMIDQFCRVGLIQKEGKSLTCEKLISRFSGLIEKRMRARGLEVSETETPVLDAETPVYSDENPQSKVKKSKVNNSKKEIPETAEIVGYLNELCGTAYRTKTKGTNSMISARIRDGFTVEDFKLVIAHKTKTWLPDEKMRNYLRPETLFCEKHFEGYLNAAKVAARSPGAGPSRNSGPHNGRATINALGANPVDYAEPQEF